jgi:hypothetical protein
MCMWNGPKIGLVQNAWLTSTTFTSYTRCFTAGMSKLSIWLQRHGGRNLESPLPPQSKKASRGSCNIDHLKSIELIGP